MASSTWLGATTSSQAEDTLTAKPPAGHHAHRCAMGQATSRPWLGLSSHLSSGMSQELRGEKGEPSKKLPSCRVTFGQTSQAPKFPCFASSLPARPWCLAHTDSGQNYAGEDPPALHQLIWLGLNRCTRGTVCELCFPLTAPSPSPSAEALCPCRDGICHAFGERRVKEGEIFPGSFGLGFLHIPFNASSSISHSVMCSGLPSLPPAVLTMRREVETSETTTVCLNHPRTKIKEVF